MGALFEKRLGVRLRFQVSRLLLGSCVALATLGCAHRLGPPAGTEVVHVETGKTTKAYVLDKLGLPTTRDTDGQLELWGYADGPAVSSVQTASVRGPNHDVALKTRRGPGAQSIVMVYVFDAAGVLVEVNDMRGKQ